MPSTPRRLARTAALVAGTAALLSVGPMPAWAAPSAVLMQTPSLGPHGLVLTWSPSGTGIPVVRDVTGLSTPYDPDSSGRLVTSAATTECPDTTCAYDTGFTNTGASTYA